MQSKEGQQSDYGRRVGELKVVGTELKAGNCETMGWYINESEIEIAPLKCQKIAAQFGRPDAERKEADCQTKSHFVESAMVIQWSRVA